jgi:hypothetical protein
MLDSKKIASIIENALISEGYEIGKSKDIAFHMTDWCNDLEKLYNFFTQLDNYSSKELEEQLIDFLCHAPNHLAAAAKLLLDIKVTDIFGVGAVGMIEEESG